jgi:hypothetical protein
MGALYQMRYQGVAGVEHGTIYIGAGTIVGVDLTGARYRGTYSDQEGTLTGSGTLTSAGRALVTGQPMPAGTRLRITFRLPSQLGDSQFNTVDVAGGPVQVAFDKVADVPEPQWGLAREEHCAASILRLRRSTGIGLDRCKAAHCI